MSAEAEQVTELSDWMSRLPAGLHNIPLFQLAIPGMRVKPHPLPATLFVKLLLGNSWLELMPGRQRENLICT